MGKFAIALLSIVFQLYLTGAISADDQVRRVQEELRKRHLFYGDTTGEISPALTAAISRYQGQKGFPRTGRLDSETCWSLGIVKAPVTPSSSLGYVVADGDVRNANGEALPNLLVSDRPSDRPAAQPASPTSETEQSAALPSAGDHATASIKKPPISKSHPRAHLRRAPPPKESNLCVLAFRSVDHAMRAIVNDPQPKAKRVSTKRER